MSIPPIGWGAIETVIWNYKVQLELLGQEVAVINTTNKEQAILQCKDFKPDIIHIHYDDYVSWSEDFLKITKNVYITSHYGYINQPNKYVPHYWKIFENFVSQDIKIIALTDKAANIYTKHGKDKSKVFVVPNGVNVYDFEYKLINENDRPTSICLAKITSRKRQNLLFGIDNIDFAGNVDYTIPVPPKNYLGEIERPQLYKNLCLYDNLILISDGEAHPLVVGEAFAAGLGVVISEYACENLDTSLPFVTVIPESKINDKFYLENRIQNNAFISREMKPEIRKYAEQKFNWDKIVLNYLEVIKK
jgi:glycosyltransferase involved in cell wall biosynthesis